MKKTQTMLLLAMFFVATSFAGAQTRPSPASLPADGASTQPTGSAATRLVDLASTRPVDRAVSGVRQQLQESVDELSRLREQIAKDTEPLSRALRDAENELIRARQEYQQTSRLLDSRALDLGSLRTEIKTREEENAYLSNLLSEYIRNFESSLHIAELQRYRGPLDAAKLAPENANLTKQEVFQAQTSLLAVSLDRLQDAMGGMRFDGKAVDAGGMVKDGTFVLVGPCAIFRSADGKEIGTVEQRLGSLEPTIIGFQASSDAEAAAQVVIASSGQFPFDPTLGNAHKIEATKETLVEHIRKGGPVMYPILALGVAAFLVVLYKWLRLSLLFGLSQKRITELLHAVARHDRAIIHNLVHAMKKPEFNFPVKSLVAGMVIGPVAAILALRGNGSTSAWVLGIIGGVAFAAMFVGIALAVHLLRRWLGYSPVARMLAIGVDHLREPRELVEEVMYENVLATRLKLPRLLPFVGLSASAAPLLGLLGTVTGIITTFKLITVYGSGDVKTLSAGISEALITTEFGLIIAIPSLMLYAFLSRKARGMTDQMEKAATGFINQISKTPYVSEDRAGVEGIAGSNGDGVSTGAQDRQLAADAV